MASQIVDIVSKQLKIDKYQPDKYPIDVGLSKIIPVEIVQKHQVVPLSKDRFLLTVAMTDPMDIDTLDKIEVLTNTEVEVVICTEKELNHIVGSMYGSLSGIGGVLEGIEEMEFERSDEIGTAAAFRRCRGRFAA